MKHEFTKQYVDRLISICTYSLHTEFSGTSNHCKVISVFWLICNDGLGRTEVTLPIDCSAPILYSDLLEIFFHLPPFKNYPAVSAWFCSLKQIFSNLTPEEPLSWSFSIVQCVSRQDARFELSNIVISRFCADICGKPLN
jgi:hypothetical protein